MGKNENTTLENDSDVAAFIDAIDTDSQRDDARALCAMMQRITGEPARMWGGAMIGFGRYEYVYPSGRQGIWLRTGFSPRKANISIYIMDGLEHHADTLAQIGKYKAGKGCLYIKRLSDVDRDVLEKLVRDSLDRMEQLYPA